MMILIIAPDGWACCLYAESIDLHRLDGTRFAVAAFTNLTDSNVNNGHLLVAPVSHVSGLDGLDEEGTLDLLLTVRRSIEVLKEAMGPEGFNVGLNLGHVAGAGVEEHMHFHIVPRWKGDTNYMTVLDDVRVIPEHIRETYRKLRPAFMG